MTEMQYRQRFELVQEFVREKLETAPGCHDFDHTMRVLMNARTITDNEPDADRRIVELAAVLHDVARPEEMASKGRFCHACKGAEQAAVIMREAGFVDEAFCEAVCRCIRCHRYRRENGATEPDALEEKIIYDADKLDSIGAVGIGRAFHFAGRENARIHNRKAEALDSEPYSREDSAYREYLVKLRHVEDSMLTATGRRLAKMRSEFMHRFFEQLNREVYGG